MAYNRSEISDATGFDRGDMFTSESVVREYFSVSAQLDMFPDNKDEDVDVLHDVLDDMAATVISNRWHCDFGDGMGYVVTMQRRDGRDRFRMWFATEREMWRGEMHMRTRDYDTTGEPQVMTKEQFAAEEGGELVQSAVLNDPEPFGWCVSPD